MRQRIARMRVLLGHEWRVVARDPMPAIVLLILPTVFTLFLSPLFEGVAETYVDDGRVVGATAMVVMFGFFGVGFGAFAFVRDHGWGMWDRLNSSALSTGEIVVAKSLVTGSIVVGQQFLLLYTATALYGVGEDALALAIIPVAIAYAASICAFSVLIITILVSIEQINAAVNLLAIVLAGFSGALAPIEELPGWVGAVSLASPQRWAMDGYRAALDAGPSGSLSATAVLLAMSLALMGVAAHRLDIERRLTSWA